MPLHYKAYQQALGDAASFFTTQMFYDLAGVPAPKVMEILKSRFSLDFDPQVVADEKEKRFGDIMHHVTAIEAVEQVIHDYHGKLPMAVASGGTRDNIVKTLELLDLTKYFEVVVSADEISNGKPAPDIFLEAARQLNAQPGDCLVFEDADMGIRAAESAGMQWVDVRAVS
jgi:HAD superfamily hydrolase (TIGR01549 family)